MANGPKLVLLEVFVNLHERLNINVLEGSCDSIDEPLAVGHDLSADEVLVTDLLFFLILGGSGLMQLRLEELVDSEVASLSGTWNQ
jgi:hypothetical protein